MKECDVDNIQNVNLSIVLLGDVDGKPESLFSGFREIAGDKNIFHLFFFQSRGDAISVEMTVVLPGDDCHQPEITWRVLRDKDHDLPRPAS